MAREFVNTSLYSDANLKGYWKLENTTDSGPNGYTLTNNGTTTFSAGKFNNAADGGSTNTTKWLAHTSTSSGLTGSSALTISGWINVTTAPATNTDQQYLETCDHTSGSTNDVAYGVKYQDVGGTKKLNFFRLKEGVAWQDNQYTITLTTGVWYHVATTYDGTNLRGYLNGVLVAGPTAATGAGSVAYGNFALISILSRANGDAKASGLVDDVQLFSRELSATEVKSIYTSRTFQKDTGNSLNVGLISYYKMGGDGTDFYGSNNLTNNNSTPFSGGKVNNGASFSGSGAKSLSVGSGIVTTSTFSISLWVKSAGTQTTYAHPLARYGTGGGLAFHYNYPTANVMNIYMNTGEGIAFSYNPNSDTNWHHLVVTSDGTTMRTYDNGSAGNTLTHNPNMGTSPNFYLGLSNLNASREWYGLVDEVGIWSKALSTTEISDLYNSGNGQTMNPPIEFDNYVINAQTGSPGSSDTKSFTVGSGTNRCLFVAAGIYVSGSNADLCTGITYGGVAMTRVNTVVQDANNRRYLYVLANPATGANNIVVSSSNGSSYFTTHAISYYGVNQTAPVEANNTASATASSITHTLTTTTDNAWIVDFLHNDGGYTYSSGATSTVVRYNGASNYAAWVDAGPFSPAGSNSLVTTQSSSGAYVAMFAAITPYVASTTNIKSINGLAYASIKNVNGLATASVKNFNGLT